ncbi:MAG: tryptophan--tRNA ligase, partial [Planctomycetota bacterium]
GEDQVPHLELTREVARRFNQIFCGVDEHAEDEDHAKLGGVFPIPRADVGKVGRLAGIDGVHKMSKSLNNAIFIADDPKEVEKKVKKIFTGRQSPTEPGDVNNVLFQYVRTFIRDEARVKELEERYAKGDNLGDGHVKVEVAAAINELLAPMRERRARYEGRDDLILEILKAGCERANTLAEATLERVKHHANLPAWPRHLAYR